MERGPNISRRSEAVRTEARLRLPSFAFMDNDEHCAAGSQAAVQPSARGGPPGGRCHSETRGGVRLEHRLYTRDAWIAASQRILALAPDIAKSDSGRRAAQGDPSGVYLMGLAEPTAP